MSWKTILIAALAGALAAAKVDFDAFKSWQSAKQARQYRWDLAVWRWFQGAVLGAATAMAPTVVTL